MKDLVFLLMTLGLITFAMMAAQSRYRSQESETNRHWEQERFHRSSQPSPSPTPSISPSRP